MLFREMAASARGSTCSQLALATVHAWRCLMVANANISCRSVLRKLMLSRQSQPVQKGYNSLYAISYSNHHLHSFGCRRAQKAGQAGRCAAVVASIMQCKAGKVNACLTALTTLPGFARAALDMASGARPSQSKVLQQPQANTCLEAVFSCDDWLTSASS